MVQRLPTSPGFADQSSQENKFFSKKHRLTALTGSMTCLAQRRDALRKKLRGITRTARAVPDERNSDTNAERSQIQYNHNQSKQIQSHRQSNNDVHRQDAHQPKESGCLHPNEKWITDFDYTDRNSEEGQRVFESNQNVGGNEIKRWPYQRSPEIGPVPPTATEKFCQASEKIDKAQVDL